MLLSVVISGIFGVDVSMLYLSCLREKAQHVPAVYQAFPPTMAGGALSHLIGVWLFAEAIGKSRYFSDADSC